MKFVVAARGSRGHIEPGAAVGPELQRRGHEVRTPQYVIGAREIAALKTRSAESVTTAVDLLEDAASLSPVD
jgi:UDP-N-acetylglucosamine:LPS N-acetylglucosamine transferase